MKYRRIQYERGRSGKEGRRDKGGKWWLNVIKVHYRYT
jgi:hypothetical protein